MKFSINLLIFLISSSSIISAQNTVKMSAVKANDYGVAYSLPKTEIKITVNFNKTIRKAGEFSKYAERYLSVSNPIKEDAVLYNLEKIEVVTYGIVDKDKSYLVEFKSGTVAPYVTLTKDGLICAINDDYVFPKSANEGGTKEETKNKPINPRSFLSEEILRAGSTAKQAELIAKQIYRLRESRTNILTGEADNMPPDGNAYKLVMDQLNEQEKGLTSLFLGSEVTQTESKEFVVIPEDKNIENKVICRFSSKLGVVYPDDLAGVPVYFSLKNINPKEEVFLTLKEEKTLSEKFSKGIIYNLPGKADLKIVFNNKVFAQKECDIVQYGTQDVLTPKMFDNNKAPIKVVFYPDFGSIKQIIQ